MEQTDSQKNSCCFTGHRPGQLPVGGEESAPEMQALIRSLEREISRAVETGVTTFYAGGAAGFDTLAAEAVLRQKAINPALRLCLALPGETPPLQWSARQKQRYDAILSAADEIYVAPADAAFPNARYHLRNRYMVDHANLVIAYLAANSGGTRSTVAYAKKKGLPVVNLADGVACFATE